MNLVIVGGGFSSYILNFYLEKNLKIKPLVISSNGFNLPNGLIKRKKLEKNKLFANHANSFGSAQFLGSGYTFHDRLIHGGNSNIWGGFININQLSKNVINGLTDAGVYVRPISKNIKVMFKDECQQLQDSRGNIFNVANNIFSTTSGYATKILNNNSLEIYKNGRYEIIKFDYLFLCLGFVQLIDLMVRSFPNLISSISTSEGIYSERLKTKIDNQSDLNDCLIYYNMSAIIKHLGLTKKYLFGFNSPYFVQNFSHKINTLDLISNGTKFYRVNHQNDYFFGKSIHYHNLKLNHVPIKKFINDQYPNILGCGASFIDQAPPGPISQELINNIINIIHEKFNINNH